MFATGRNLRILGVHRRVIVRPRTANDETFAELRDSLGEAKVYQLCRTPSWEHDDIVRFHIHADKALVVQRRPHKAGALETFDADALCKMGWKCQEEPYLDVFGPQLEEALDECRRLLLPYTGHHRVCRRQCSARVDSE